MAHLPCFGSCTGCGVAVLKAGWGEGQELNMVGLVVATHGRLADELVATAEQIVGKLPSVATCSIEPGTSPADIRERMRAVVESVDSGDGVIVMADLFGGTPCKESMMLCQKAGNGIEILAGVNLPMLIKANSLRISDESMSLPDMAHALLQHAQRNITCVSDLIREHQRPEPPRSGV